MRRLRRQARAITLFHGTIASRLQAISQTGIAAGNGSSVWENSNQNYTFFTNKRHLAVDYAASAYVNGGEQPDEYLAILRVRLDTDILSPDLNDCPTCTTWRESLDKVQQVAIAGSVPAAQVTEVELLDSHSEESIGTFQLADFQDPTAIFERLGTPQDEKQVRLSLTKDVKSIFNTLVDLHTRVEWLTNGTVTDYNTSMLEDYIANKISFVNNLNQDYDAWCTKFAWPPLNAFATMVYNDNNIPILEINILGVRASSEDDKGMLNAKKEDCLDYFDANLRILTATKRLQRRASVIFYHGTTLGSLVNIAAVGLQPNQASGWGNTAGGQVFFTNNQDKTFVYCQRKWGSEGGDQDNLWVILEVNLDGLELLPDNDDCPTCEDYEESLSKCGQLAVEGTVEPNRIIGLSFYYPLLTHRVLSTCSFTDYITNPSEIVDIALGSAAKHDSEREFEEAWGEGSNGVLGDVITMFEVVVDYLMDINNQVSRCREKLLALELGDEVEGYARSPAQKLVDETNDRIDRSIIELQDNVDQANKFIVNVNGDYGYDLRLTEVNITRESYDDDLDPSLTYPIVTLNFNKDRLSSNEDVGDLEEFKLQWLEDALA